MNQIDDKMKKLADAVKDMDLTSIQAVQFGIALNAVSLLELDKVIETTNSKSIQDYAIYKANFLKQNGAKS